MDICVITNGYPTPNNPEMFVFVDQLVSAWADQGINVYVICPRPMLVELFDKSRFYKSEWEKETESGNTIKIYAPRYFRFSDRKIGPINTQKLSYYHFQSAVRKTIRNIPGCIDILYSHFLSAGCHAGDIGHELGIPAFCAFGESVLWSIKGWNVNKVKESLAKLSGIISVSTENKKKLIDNALYKENKIEVIPNGVDHSLFYPRDRLEIRKKYGFSEKAFIGVFIGKFNDSKGVLRAQEASIKAGCVQMIYIGGGEQKLEGDNILFQGKLQHEFIPEYLSAADFFILPTKAEGCCNAIIEAMACGLPIISAEGAYNDDILSDKYSIRTNPTDINAMAEAIERLKHNPDLRESMSRAAKEASKRFDITKRAALILDFFNQNR